MFTLGRVCTHAELHVSLRDAGGDSHGRRAAVTQGDCTGADGVRYLSYSVRLSCFGWSVSVRVLQCHPQNYCLEAETRAMDLSVGALADTHIRASRRCGAGECGYEALVRYVRGLSTGPAGVLFASARTGSVRKLSLADADATRGREGGARRRWEQPVGDGREHARERKRDGVLRVSGVQAAGESPESLSRVLEGG